jgi:hypothetical protein
MPGTLIIVIEQVAIHIWCLRVGLKGAGTSTIVNSVESAAAAASSTGGSTGITHGASTHAHVAHTKAATLATFATKFKPNAVTNVVFLLALGQTISVTLANYTGRPFIQGTLY